MMELLLVAQLALQKAVQRVGKLEFRSVVLKVELLVGLLVGSLECWRVGHLVCYSVG